MTNNLLIISNMQLCSGLTKKSKNVCHVKKISSENSNFNLIKNHKWFLKKIEYIVKWLYTFDSNIFYGFDFSKCEFSGSIFSYMAKVFGNFFGKSRANSHADHAEHKISRYFFDFVQISPLTKLVTFSEEIASCTIASDPRLCLKTPLSKILQIFGITFESCQRQ